MASSAVSATRCRHDFRHAAAGFRDSGRARRGYYRQHGRFIGSVAWNLLLTHPLSRSIIVKLCKETTSNSSWAAQQSPRLVLECEWFLESQDCNIGAGHNALAEAGLSADGRTGSASTSHGEDFRELVSYGLCYVSLAS